MERQADTEIEITPEMIEAGVYLFRELPFGMDPKDIVTDIFIAMMAEKALSPNQ